MPRIRSANYCRRKGLSFERFVANKLKKIFPDARRLLEFQESEANGVDLAHTGEFKIQCKAFKKYAPITCIEEIQLCPIEGGIPVLITKGDSQTPMAVLPFDEFIKLIKKANRC